MRLVIIFTKLISSDAELLQRLGVLDRVALLVVVEIDVGWGPTPPLSGPFHKS